MTMSAYRLTSISPLLELPVILTSGWFMLAGNEVIFLGCLAAYIAWRFVVLRCPRCRAPTWTRRFAKGHRGFLNQYVGLTNPEGCNLCGLDLRRHSVWQRIKWNGERYMG